MITGYQNRLTIYYQHRGIGKLHMKRILYLSCLLAALLLLNTCKTKRKTQQESNLTVDVKAKELFREGYQIIDNSDNTYALVVKEVKTRPNQIYPTVHFFVFHHATSEHFYLQSLAQGSVKWYNVHELLCESIPGRVSGGEGKKRYLYNVLSKTTKPYQ